MRTRVHPIIVSEIKIILGTCRSAIVLADFFFAVSSNSHRNLGKTLLNPTLFLFLKWRMVSANGWWPVGDLFVKYRLTDFGASDYQLTFLYTHLSSITSVVTHKSLFTLDVGGSNIRLKFSLAAIQLNLY